MKKKNLLFTLILLAVSLCINAQGIKLSSEMNAFYKYCLDVREGYQKKNAELLKSAIKEWNGENLLKYNNEELVLAELLTPGDLNVINDKGLLSIGTHLKFDPISVDSIIVYGFDKDFTEEPETTRGMYSCLYANRCIAPGKEVIYEMNACGDCELFVVSEKSLPISVSVSNSETKKEMAKCKSDAACLKWTMDSGKVILKIKNLSKEAQSIVIASN